MMTGRARAKTKPARALIRLEEVGYEQELTSSRARIGQRQLLEWLLTKKR
jgi:hypothetical protein